MLVIIESGGYLILDGDYKLQRKYLLFSMVECVLELNVEYVYIYSLFSIE